MNTRRSAGFTLIELLVTIAICAVLAGIGAPAYRDALARHRLTTAAADFHAAILLARSEATGRGMQVMIAPLDGVTWESGWQVSPDPNANKTQDSNEALILRRDPLPDGIKVSGSTKPIVINAYGRALPANSWFFQIDDQRRRKVVINFLGRPMICEPKADDSC